MNYVTGVKHMHLCATLTAGAALLALRITAMLIAGGARKAIRETIKVSKFSAHTASLARATKGTPPGTPALPSESGLVPHSTGSLQWPSARSDPGSAEGLPPRGCWRGAAASKTRRVLIAVGCVLISVAGCASGLPESTSANAPAVAPVAPTTSAVKDRAIPGIGATRADWDASHTPNTAFNNEMVYGENPGLPSYLAANGAVYIEVSDLGTKRIQSYNVNMQAATRHQALERVRQELPSDAAVAWDLRLNHCTRVAFASPTLEAAGHYMAEVQLEFLKVDATTEVSPHSFNQARFQLDTAGSPPNPEINCGHRIRDSTVDLRAGTLTPTGQELSPRMTAAR
jgi:hypothetical protein